MHTLGIKLLAIFYFAAGAFIGESLSRIFHDRGSELSVHHAYVWMVLGVNIVAITCLILIGRRMFRETPLERIEPSLRTLVRGLPVTNRVAFLLFTTCYVIGLGVGLFFA